MYMIREEFPSFPRRRVYPELDLVLRVARVRQFGGVSVV
jgi:hypothetical protein